MSATWTRLRCPPQRVPVPFSIVMEKGLFLVCLCQLLQLLCWFFNRIPSHLSLRVMPSPSEDRNCERRRILMENIKTAQCWEKLQLLLLSLTAVENAIVEGRGIPFSDGELYWVYDEGSAVDCEDDKASKIFLTEVYANMIYATTRWQYGSSLTPRPWAGQRHPSYKKSLSFIQQP